MMVKELTKVSRVHLQSKLLKSSLSNKLQSELQFHHIRRVRHDDHTITKGASMWGVCGQIEEKTKLAAWLVFDRLRQKLLGVYLIFPSNKQQAFQSMVKNADDTGWILPYQFQRSLVLQRPTRLRHVAMPPHHGEGAIAPYGADELNKAQVYRDIRGIALHGNRHEGHLLSDRPHGLPRRVRQLPAFLVPTRDRAQYVCREYYGDTPCAPEEVSEASSGMEYDHCTER